MGKLFLEKDKELSKLLSSTRAFLGARLKEQKDSKEQTEVVKKLQERATKVQEEIATTKKTTAVHEKRSLGTRLLAEAKEEVGGLEAEVKKATDACAPLLEQGGVEFLIGVSIKTLVAALQAHMKEKAL